LNQGEVVAALGKTGHAVPTGAEASVGIGGVTLGGGIGMMSRSLGVTCDGLIALDMVVPHGTDDARLIHVDQDHHADLLGGGRGGGCGNFGIATSYPFRVHEVSAVSYFKLEWDWSDPTGPFNAWQAWAPAVDNRLGSTFAFLLRSSNLMEAEGIFQGPADD